MDEQQMNYTFEPVAESTSGAPDAPQPAPRGKRRTWLKITALLLALALVAGLGRTLLSQAIHALETHNTAGEDAALSADPAPATPAETESAYTITRVPLPETLARLDETETLSAQEVYSLNVDAVCGIATEETTNVFGQTAVTAVVGSGFLLTEDGYVITNNHVTEGAASLTVMLHDGRSYPATLIGGDSLSDVALLKIEESALPHVYVGDSDDISVGEGCLAIGNPLGELTFTMTGGYISALPREINISGKPISMLQTDASINPGNSGGPLFDMHGNVIGITSAKMSGITGSGASIEGIGFAIPINDALRVVYDLQEYGYVRGRAFLGVTLKDLDATTAATYGLPVGPIVQSIVAGSCAERGGIQLQDIILAIDDRTVQTYSELLSALNQRRAGDVITLRVLRGGAQLDLTITLDERPEENTVTQVEQGEIDNAEEYSYYYDPDAEE